MSYGLFVPLLHILFVAPLLFYAGFCLKKGKNCINGFSQFLMGLALVIMLFHLYNLIVRLGYIEGFVRQGGYLGMPLESFVPFSFPYQKESDRYYSYHDNEHTRNCNCLHNDGNNTCNHTDDCGHKRYDVIEPFDTIAPAYESNVCNKA